MTRKALVILSLGSIAIIALLLSLHIYNRDNKTKDVAMTEKQDSKVKDQSKVSQQDPTSNEIKDTSHKTEDLSPKHIESSKSLVESKENPTTAEDSDLSSNKKNPDIKLNGTLGNSKGIQSQNKNVNMNLLNSKATKDEKPVEKNNSGSTSTLGLAEKPKDNTKDSDNKSAEKKDFNIERQKRIDNFYVF